eukprot:2856854-Rhodomonas_salina.1
MFITNKHSSSRGYQQTITPHLLLTLALTDYAIITEQSVTHQWHHFIPTFTQLRGGSASWTQIV